MNGIIHIHDETYRSDRNGNDLELLPGIVSVHPTWDIDRAGSKGQIDVVAESGILEPNMWITTYRTITPERGEIIRYQRGHWRLSSPGIVYDGAVHMDTGASSQQQTAKGYDIIEDIAGAGLTETFYTPIAGNVMQDVSVAVQMATCGIMGPNLAGNSGFESGTSGWSSWGSYALSVSTGTPSVWEPAEGAQSGSQMIPSAAALNVTGGFYRDIPIPAGAQFMYLSALAGFSGDWYGVDPAIQIEWRTSSDEISRSYGTAIVNRTRWNRTFFVAAVPPGAVIARIACNYKKVVAAGGTQTQLLWDDIRCGVCTMMPLPDSRIQLPNSTVPATTRIQTMYDMSYGYDAINADRLSAIGHYALSTTMAGELTTMPIRTLANTQPRYTFHAGDRRLLAAPVEIPALSGSIYNHFRAKKEDFGDGGGSMIAHAYNDNPNDPNSTVITGRVLSAPVVVVQDAVSQDALQAIAERERDRQSVRETIRLITLPLPDLTIYDVIRIDDPSMPKANGLWAMNSIDDTDIGMVITASRAIGGG